MQSFTVVGGAAVLILQADIDTDLISRIERLTSLAKDPLCPCAFGALRLDVDGSDDPDFSFNRPSFCAAPFVLAGLNVGCGLPRHATPRHATPRQGAVWALQGLGVRGVVAPSDSGNGYTNCFQNGVLPMRLPIEQVEVLVAQRAGGASSTVDLAQATSVAPDSTQTTFAIDPLRREALLNAIDGSGLTLKDDALIRAWQADGRRRRPWAWPA